MAYFIAPRNRILPATARWTLLLSCILGGTSCKSNDSEEDNSSLEDGLIGPDGGEVVEYGITISIPPGALTKEIKVEIKKSSENLSASDFIQKGSAFQIVPEETILRLPAKVSFEKFTGEASPSVLFRQDELVVATLGKDAYINEFNVIAQAEAGSASTKLVIPELASSPESAVKQSPAIDSVDFNFSVHDISALELVLTAYDIDNKYSETLNGTLQGECAFQLDQIKGGSLSNNCASGLRTATITILDSILQFRTTPFLAPKLEYPIVVSVIAGSNNLAYFLGFMHFKSGSCFGESCSGRGVCEEDENGARCVCEEGFAPEGLSCVCLPQCSGRQCGPDGCGGRCDPGCGSNESCDNQSGQCQSNDDSDDQGDDQGDSESTSSTTGDEGGSTSSSSETTDTSSTDTTSSDSTESTEESDSGTTGNSSTGSDSSETSDTTSSDGTSSSDTGSV